MNPTTPWLSSSKLKLLLFVFLFSLVVSLYLNSKLLSSSRHEKSSLPDDVEMNVRKPVENQPIQGVGPVVSLKQQKEHDERRSIPPPLSPPSPHSPVVSENDKGATSAKKTQQTYIEAIQAKARDLHRTFDFQNELKKEQYEKLARDRFVHETMVSREKPNLLMINDGMKNDSKKVAYVIFITQWHPFMLDGAAVLRESIRQNHRGPRKYDMVALAWTHSSDEEAKGEAILQAMDYTIRFVSVPVKLDEIQNTTYRQKMAKSGCCGEKEFLKLQALTMTEYHRVIMLDTDVVLRGSIDDLFELNTSLVFTYDYPMVHHWMRTLRPCMQGGFFIAQPNTIIFNHMVDLIHLGHFDSFEGWFKSYIGGCYGGETVQGIMSFYYNTFVDPSKIYEVDVCRINGRTSGQNAQGEECRFIQDEKNVKLFHFTMCGKPWRCEKSNMVRSELCARVTTEWWDYRNAIERSMKQPIISMRQGCNRGVYRLMQYKLSEPKNK